VSSVLDGLRAERDACGIGFVADANGVPARRLVDLALGALASMRHRGAVAADGATSDGAGLLLPLVPALQPVPGCAVGMVFGRDPRDRERVEEACAAEGFEVAGWREPLHDPSALGRVARESMPRLDQVVIERPPGLDDSELERRLFRTRKRIVRRGGPYVASLSFRTIVFKALCAGEALADFYVELARDDLEVPFAVFHQRFSTNTAPSWERAQPFRMLAHNGEINTIEGNANWMRAREATLDERDLPALEAGGSDSALLDNAVELLVRGGRDVRHALAMLVPPAWQAEPSLSDAERDFFRFHAGLTEPWDGPAGLVFSDGQVVGAAADRNGLRPLRTAICESGLVVCASEAGVVDLSGEGHVTRGRVGPGQLLIVAPGRGVESDGEIKRRLAAQRPYGEWLRRGRSSHYVGTPLAEAGGDLIRRQALFGYTREELAKIIRPIAASGHEPISSMGDDTAIPPLADPARTFYGFFRQRFAQVTNPPIDPLRERLVMSLTMVLGARAPFDSRDYEVAHGISVPSFFLYPDALEALKPIRLDATFTREETLAQACERLSDEAETYVGLGHEVLAVSDRFAGGERAPIPALLATGVVHHHLVARGLRARTTVVVESGEPREVHHFACLLGYGAEAVCAPLALQTICSLAQNDRIGGDRPSPEEAQERFRTAIENGVLKVMSKLGIAELSGYCGAQLFETIGLSPEVVEAGFVGTPARIAGVGFGEIEGEALGRLADSNAAKAQLANPGYIKFRKGGEAHATTPEVVAALHDLTVKREMKAAHELRAAVTREDRVAYERFAELVDGRTPLELRDLLDFKEGRGIPIEEVEPAESIVRRFSSGAMSHGSLSAEAHEAIAVAFNALGARSNSGEGGEDPARYRTERRSKIKQIASGRFGVTASYAAFAEELQIKVAQGSKPGEGGQLPGHKVTPEIARLRHTRPGVALISPPPHHDIYSIEDLAQLIFDLRQVAPQADVSVKLVAESGVGMVAAGVAKALADVIHIAGADGGTGASPLSSIKNAGAPWELGLVEAQRELIANGLRGRVRLRVDGGFRTGRDVLLAALLGADEVSFGTVLLIAEGCLMVRSCHVDTCPVGIATQRPELRAKFAGRPEMIVAYLLNVAEDVRARLAALGLRSFEEAVGRSDLLVRREAEDVRSPLLDLSLLLDAPASGETTRYAYRSVPRAPGGELGEALVDAGTQERIPITNRDRTVGAHLSGELVRRAAAGGPTELRHYRFTGSAGQSFGAFLIEGVELELEGEANDYVAKSMSGGRIVIHPPANDAGEPHLVGNTVLYGATGGELFCAGRAGERFAVRNSGARAVVEGVGAHGCEYMTGGTVVVLGPVGPNFGAGMTGGRAAIFDPDEALDVLVNHELVDLSPLGEAVEEIRALVEAHQRRTGSPRAEAILASWPSAVGSFRLVRPRDDVATVSSAHEGSAVAGDEQSA